MSIVGKLRTACSLPRQDRQLIARAWVLLPLFHVALRTLPACGRRWLLAGSGLALRGPLAGEDLWREASRRKDAVDIAARNHLLTFRCLSRALVLRTLLARSRIPVDLHIGVRKSGGQVEAHAWLECMGQPLAEPENVVERFSVLESVEEYRERHLRSCEP